MMKENRRAVIDIDGTKRRSGKELARALFRKHPSELDTLIIETAKGFHFHFEFEGEAKSRKIVLDGEVIGDEKKTGYVLWLGSVFKGFVYRIVHDRPLKPFPEQLFPETKQRKEIIRGKINHVRAYLRKVVSVQGQNGSAGLIRAAAICRDAGMSESQATIALLEWNSGPTVSPPWPHEEIARAVTRVFQKVKA
jgi:hypothetical protein